MQRRKKQLLGFLGLAFVVAMTIFAYAIPAPGASAAENTVKLKVDVVPGDTMPYVEIASITEGEVKVNKSFDVTIRYLRTTELKVSITNNGPLASPADTLSVSRAAETVELDLTGSSCAKENIIFSDDSWNECTVTYNLPGSLAGQYGVSFITQAIAYNGNYNNTASNPDAKSFYYRSAKFADKIDYDQSNGDPIVTIEMSDDVKRGELVIFDQNGNPIFGSSETQEGKYPAIPFDGYSVDNNGKVVVKLPFGEKELASGEYQIVLIAYGDGKTSEGTDEVVALAVTKVPYYAIDDPNNPGYDPNKPVNPDDPDNPNKPTPPDTGSVFSDLNISRADYIVTGLIAFGVVTGFAVFLILRRNKR